MAKTTLLHMGGKNGIWKSTSITERIVYVGDVIFQFFGGVFAIFSYTVFR